jgi:hypothetical protein
VRQKCKAGNSISVCVIRSQRKVMNKSECMAEMMYREKENPDNSVWGRVRTHAREKGLNPGRVCRK